MIVPRVESRWPKPIERRTPLAAVLLWSACAVAGVGVLLVLGYLPWQNGLLGWALVTVAVVALIVGGPGQRQPRGESAPETRSTASSVAARS